MGRRFIELDAKDLGVLCLRRYLRFLPSLGMIIVAWRRWLALLRLLSSDKDLDKREEASGVSERLWKKITGGGRGSIFFLSSSSCIFLQITFAAGWTDRSKVKARFANGPMNVDSFVHRSMFQSDNSSSAHLRAFLVSSSRRNDTRLFRPCVRGLWIDLECAVQRFSRCFVTDESIQLK